jgi:hypothetical protein
MKAMLPLLAPSASPALTLAICDFGEAQLRGPFWNLLTQSEMIW